MIKMPRETIAVLQLPQPFNVNIRMRAALLVYSFMKPAQDVSCYSAVSTSLNCARFHPAADSQILSTGHVAAGHLLPLPVISLNQLPSSIHLAITLQAASYTFSILSLPENIPTCQRKNDHASHIMASEKTSPAYVSAAASEKQSRRKLDLPRRSAESSAKSKLTSFSRQRKTRPDRDPICLG